jgi:hypothetical protein
MSAMLESLLDDERRIRCRANDAAMATGRPIIECPPTTPRLRCAGDLQPRTVSPQSERSHAALVTAHEFC